MRKLSKLASEAMIDHKAFVMAKADEKKLDLMKYRQQIIKNFHVDSDSDSENKNAQNVSPSITLDNYVEGNSTYFAVLHCLPSDIIH